MEVALSLGTMCHLGPLLVSLPPLIIHHILPILPPNCSVAALPLPPPCGLLGHPARPSTGVFSTPALLISPGASVSTHSRDFGEESPSLTTGWARLGVPPSSAPVPFGHLWCPATHPTCLRVTPAVAGAASSERVQAVHFLSCPASHSAPACPTEAWDACRNGPGTHLGGEGVHTPRGIGSGR